MKIVLQNIETLAFFGSEDEWTTDLEEALGFGDAVEASTSPRPGKSPEPEL